MTQGARRNRPAASLTREHAAQKETITMQLGALIPLGDIGGDPATVRSYAQQAESLGYDFIEAPDHVLGVNVGIAPGLGPQPQHVGRPVPRSVRAVRLPRRLHAEARLLHRRADPAAAPDGAGGEAGRLPGRAVRRALPPGHRRRLERGGVHRPERKLPQPRPPVGGAGAGDAAAVGADRMSASTAAITRSRMPASIPAPPPAACRCGSAAITSTRWNASPNGATAGCRTPTPPTTAALTDPGAVAQH